MIAAEELRRLSFHEKLEAMETLWADLARQEDQVEVPQWHKVLLDEREELIRQGKAKFVDWETAKQEIKRAVS